MRPTRSGAQFTIIGENIHATRTLLRSGRHIAPAPDGRDVIRFETAGGERYLAIPDALRESADYAGGRVKHVQAALLGLLAGSEPDASDARAYIETLARRQAGAGADYIDLNVDEVAQDTSTQQAAMQLLVQIVEALGAAPPSLDSSNASVIRAGVEASTCPERLLLNSASVERLDVLDMAASARCSVVASAAGQGGLPAGSDDRVANAERIVGEATRRGIAADATFVDPLVIPVAVEPEAGAWFLEAVIRIRQRLGPDMHITGGLSNVSFGLPARRLVNDVFIDLAADAGADSGIVDPVASDLTRVFGRDQSSRPYKLATDLLTGADPYGLEFLEAYRAGELTGEP
ncbi:MAG: dihydropteroate synthase [Candidatus Limnocylindrales bacterium]|jgi:5-methyltetrahydrofolate--homocysteine methyltransferase